MNSWPMTSPSCIVGTYPSTRCRSEPQIAVEVIRTMASRLFRIFGSGTSRTSTELRPAQVFALMPPLPSRARRPTAAAPDAAGTPCGPACPRGPVGPDHLAGLQHLLEPAQIVVELLVRFLAEVLGDRLADRATRNVVHQDDMYLGAHTVRGRHEPDRTGVRHVGVPGRAPRDLLTGRLVDDLRVPLDIGAERGAGDPVAGPVAGGADLLEVRHERREVLPLAPEGVHLRRGFADGSRGRQLHGFS